MTTDRLPRLLALVPYLLARPGVRVAEAAADFGVSVTQLRGDLELLWMCGLPGHGPGDLIDLSFDGDTVTVTYDAGMSRPLRLSTDEALALVVALRTLAEVPGLSAREAVERALAKVERAAGERARAAEAVAVHLDAEEKVLAVIQEALTERRALHLKYYAFSRDEITERDVDPMRLLLAEGRSYLEAWCRGADGVRLFRLDRIDALYPLDEPSRPPAEATPRDLAGGVYQPTADHPLVTLRLTVAARWVADYYPCEFVHEIGGGAVDVGLHVADTRWLRQLMMRLGTDAQLRSPSWLATDLRSDVEAALAAYGADGG